MKLKTKKKDGKIIGVISQFDSVSPEKQKRKYMWEEFFRNQNVQYFLDLDSFWDSPSKVDLLHSFIPQCLSGKPEKLSSFESVLRIWEENKSGRLQKVCIEFADCLINCRETKITTSNTDAKKEESQKECSQTVLSRVEKFIESTKKIFDIEVNITEEDIQKVVSKNDYVVRYIPDDAGDTTGKAAFGSLIGAICGSIVPGVGTAIGAGIGTPIGAGIGYLTSRAGKIETSLSLNNLRCISVFCLAYLSACLFCGYGRYGLKIEEEQRKHLDYNKIDIFIKNTSEYCSQKNDLIVSGKSEIVEWGKTFLNKL